MRNLLLEGLSASCRTLLGEGSWKPEPGFLQIPCLVLLPFVILLCIQSLLTDVRCKDDCVLSPVSPSKESVNFGVVYLGNPAQKAHVQQVSGGKERNSKQQHKGCVLIPEVVLWGIKI